MNSARWMSTALLLLFAAPAFPGTKDDVTLADDVQVNGKKLVLNGMGLRTKTMFSVHVYVAGLYLPAKTNDAGKVVYTEEEKCLVMHFVHDADKGKLVDAWKEGFDNNAPQAKDKLKDQIEKLCGWMEDLKKGDELTFTYIPGKGLEVKVKAEVKGTIEGWEFTSNFLLIWFGPKPPTEDLQKGLLGKE